MALLCGACSRPAEPPAPPTTVDPEAIQAGADELAYLRSSGALYTGAVLVKHANGTNRAEIHFKDGRQHGAHKEWNPDGNPALETYWINGLRDGLQTIWFDSGQKKREGKWVGGKPVTGREWSEDGKQEWAITFVDGQMTERKIVQNKSLTLPEKDRLYLWDTEHHGGLLMKLGFGPWKTALKSRDKETLARALSSDFQAHVAPKERGQQWVRNYDNASAARTEFAEADRAATTPAAFIDWLLNQRGIFGGTLDIGNSLAAFAPVDREKKSGHWGGLLHIRMSGKNSAGGPAELIISLDIELDYPTEEALGKGGWLRRCAVRSIKQSTAKQPLMTEVAERIGLQPGRLHDNWKRPHEETISNTGGVFACDFNRDGLTDLLITDAGLPKGYAFYTGELGGKFRETTTEVGITQERFFSQAAFVDLDGDGWVDLVTNSGTVYRNAEGHRFENVTSQSNLAGLTNLPQQWAETNFAVADFDRDGQMDLYVFHTDSSPLQGSWIDGKVGSKVTNQLLRNVGGWRFDDVTAATGTDGGHRSTFSSVWLDADNNGWPDLYVINEYGNGILLLNQGRGKMFLPTELVGYSADFGSMGLTSGDIDNDGHIDLYVASMYSKAGTRVIGNLRDDAYPADVTQKLRRMVSGSQLYRNVGGLKFEPMGAAWDLRAVGWAYAPALVDLDNDGFLDLHATAGFISRFRDKPDG